MKSLLKKQATVNAPLKFLVVVLLLLLTTMSFTSSSRSTTTSATASLSYFFVKAWNQQLTSIFRQNQGWNGKRSLFTTTTTSTTTSQKISSTSKATSIRYSPALMQPGCRFQQSLLSSTSLSMSTTSSSSPSASSASTANIKKIKNAHVSSSTTKTNTDNKMINLHTIPQKELESVLESWGQPKYRAKQIWNWVRIQGVTNFDEMNNLPKKLLSLLQEHATIGSLRLATEQTSKDGTIKRAYRLHDGQLIESVLMPYEDGRYTACISSQAGCAQGCVFCATGQMGFSRQLTSDEIFEQVARFASELAYQDKQEVKERQHQQKQQQQQQQNKHPSAHANKSSSTRNPQRPTRLSNIVFMGMGEPLANYRNVKAAVERIHSELGIGHRRITISTVGIVPNILRLAQDLPQVKLAVSLHCATDEERTALLPANRRNGGLQELMSTLYEYVTMTGRRITLEWALIEEENDTPEMAHQLGKLIQKNLRKDMVHVNVIPLNPTGGYGGSPSGRKRVNKFCSILEDMYGVACTPRVRRGIDIDAGCGQLKAEVERIEKQKQQEQEQNLLSTQEEQEPSEEGEIEIILNDHSSSSTDDFEFDFVIDDDAILMTDGDGDEGDDDENDWEDYEYKTSEELSETERLLNLVKGSVITSENSIIGKTTKKKDD